MPKLLLVLFLASLTHAAETHVVAAGVEQYDDARISSLKFAAADARAVAAVFRASGVPRQNVALLTTEARAAMARPSRIGLITALQSARDRCRPGDTLIFFFGGHGVEQDGEQYLLSSDTRRDLLAETALPLALVNKALKGIEAEQVLFILDACRNDPDAGKGDTDARMTDGLARGLRPKVVSQAGGPKLTATLLSCDVGERAFEDPKSGHGAFTVALLRGLQGAAAEAGQPVRLGRLAAYVQDEVNRWATREGKHQTPKLLSPDGQDMDLLTPPTEPVVSVTFRNVTLTDAIAELAAEYGTQIVLGPGVDPGGRVNGRLELQPLGTALRLLLLALDLKVRRDGPVYVIEKPVTAAAPSPAPSGGRPAGWPEYLSSYQPPTGMSWSSYRVSPKDGMPQVLIPAGEFLMGSPADEKGRRDDEGPQKRVYVSAFWMDLHEVTVGQYQRFCRATNRKLPPPSHHGWEDRHPVSNVTWDDAAAYCQWAGRRLPTEAEWVKAARGGREGQAYVWGTQWPPPRGGGNFGSIDGYDDGYAGVAPVGSFAPNGYGLFDLAGNVWEWCQDWYDEGWYARMPGRDPCNTTNGDARVQRGGSSFLYVVPRYLRAANRYRTDPGGRNVLFGFRAAAGAAQGS